jgi:hypothetical protein
VPRFVLLPLLATSTYQNSRGLSTHFPDVILGKTKHLIDLLDKVVLITKCNTIDPMPQRRVKQVPILQYRDRSDRHSFNDVMAQRHCPSGKGKEKAEPCQLLAKRLELNVLVFLAIDNTYRMFGGSVLPVVRKAYVITEMFPQNCNQSHPVNHIKLFLQLAIPVYFIGKISRKKKFSPAFPRIRSFPHPIRNDNA